jgi:hypothetical protein
MLRMVLLGLLIPLGVGVWRQWNSELHRALQQRSFSPMPRQP